MFLGILTESHLSNYIENSESEISGCEQIQCDRSKRIGGVIVCYVKDNIPVTNSKIFSNSYCEAVCFCLPSINLVNITIYPYTSLLISHYIPTRSYIVLPSIYIYIYILF